MYITMLGVGNGFTPGVYNNNALLECGQERALIDCGVTAWDSLGMLGLGQTDIHRVFITHVHFDHAGGLEALALYSKYITGQRIQLILPRPIRALIWEQYLCGALDNPFGGCHSLEDYFDIVSPEEGESFTICGDVQARWFRTRHIEGKFSCGLFIAGQLVYTSDMVADAPLLDSLCANGAQAIFHDCQLEHASVHASLEDILAYPSHIKDKLYLMHHGLLVPPKSPLKFLVQQQRMAFDFMDGTDAQIRTSGETDALVEKTVAFIREKQLRETTGHDWFHTQRVYLAAMRLANAAGPAIDRRIVALAALLHDIADWKFNGGDEEAGPKAAAQWLQSCGAEPETIACVQKIIRDLSFKGIAERKAMSTAEGEIVQDADRLDAIGAIGVARAFATGAALGNLLLDPELPPRESMRSSEYKDRTATATTLNHFYEKLLHLHDLMNTREACAEAAGRHRFMASFLQELFLECGMQEGLHQKLLSEYLT